MKLLVLGAGYVGGALAARALAEGHEVVLADNWWATERAQVAELEGRGAEVRTVDVRDRTALDAVLDERPDRVVLLAAQASRPLSEREPGYTEETNATGVRLVAEAVAARPDPPPIAFGSSLHVYGPGLRGEIGPGQPYGRQDDLAHLTKVYGELCLSMHARRAGFGLDLLRLGIVYGPSPVEHDRPESETVVNRFRRLAAAGEPLPVEGTGEATLGVVHVADVASIALGLGDEPGVRASNVAAESVTVRGIADLAGGRAPTVAPTCVFATPFAYEHDLAGYLQP